MADLVFAVLSLTVLRMVPVALCLLGMESKRWTVAFSGGSGPRAGVGPLGSSPTSPGLHKAGGVQTVIGVVATTVVLSVLLHGLMAGPWAVRYGDGRSGPVHSSRPSTPSSRSRSTAPAGLTVLRRRVGDAVGRDGYSPRHVDVARPGQGHALMAEEVDDGLGRRRGHRLRFRVGRATQRPQARDGESAASLPE